MTEAGKDVQCQAFLKFRNLSDDLLETARTYVAHRKLVRIRSTVLGRRPEDGHPHRRCGWVDVQALRLSATGERATILTKRL